MVNTACDLLLVSFIFVAATVLQTIHAPALFTIYLFIYLFASGNKGQQNTYTHNTQLQLLLPTNENTHTHTHTLIEQPQRPINNARQCHMPHFTIIFSNYLASDNGSN